MSRRKVTWSHGSKKRVCLQSGKPPLLNVHSHLLPHVSMTPCRDNVDVHGTNITVAPLAVNER